MNPDQFAHDSNQTEEAQHVQPTAGEAQFAIVELMGHLQLGGRISEVRYGGADLIRLDTPTPDDGWATQYIGAGAVYRITFCDETIARSVSRSDLLPVNEINIFKQLEKMGYGIVEPQSQAKPIASTTSQGTAPEWDPFLED